MRYGSVSQFHDRPARPWPDRKGLKGSARVLPQSGIWPAINNRAAHRQEPSQEDAIEFDKNSLWISKMYKKGSCMSRRKKL